MGYVSALFIRARHLMTMGETEREAANSEPRNMKIDQVQLNQLEG